MMNNNRYTYLLRIKKNAYSQAKVHQIVVRTKDGDYDVVATCENIEACRRLVRMAQFFEDMESLFDQLLGDMYVQNHRRYTPCPVLLEDEENDD